MQKIDKTLIVSCHLNLLTSQQSRTTMKNVLVIGTRRRLDEFRNVKLENATISYLDQFYLEMDQMDLPIEEMEKPQDEYYIDQVNIATYDIVFDLALDEHPENLDHYVGNVNQVVIGGAVKITLAQMVAESGYELECKLFGMNALPSFLDRAVFEMSILAPEDSQLLAKTMQELGREFELVDDRIGMVTPRIVCMIINEACFVLKEGTAEIADVDQAMKLGTNYPHGPFEWADLMGLHNVYDVVKALREDTGEEKYKMAPLLKQYYYREQNFYS